MIRYCFAIAAAVALSACTQAPAAPETNNASDIAAVTALRNGFVTAMTAGDAEAFRNLYTADGISQHNHDKTVTGRDAIVESQKAMFSQFGVKLEIMAEETMTMGGFGFDRGHFKMTLTPKSGGDPITDEGRYIVLLQKEADGSWKVSRDIDNSTMPVPVLMAMPPMPGMEKK